MSVKINHRKCTGCHECYKFCPMDVFAIDDRTSLPVVAHEEECWHCGICYIQCSKRAIDVTIPASFW